MTSSPDRHDDPGVNPALEQLLDARLRAFSLDLQVCCPAHVIAYAGGVADVQLGRLPVKGGVVQPPLVVPGCPVAWLGNGTTASQSWDLLPGAIGLALFADRALDRWLEQLAPCDPVSGRAHGLECGMFLPLVPGVTPAATPGATVIEDTAIMLGAAAVQPAARGTDLAVALNAYATSITTATSTLAALAAAWLGVPGVNQVAFANGFAPFLAAITTAQTALATAVAAALSTKVRVE